MGDERTYEYVLSIRAVTSIDGMTADIYHFDTKFLAQLSGKIISQVRGVNRVTYDVTSKPPGTIEWEWVAIVNPTKNDQRSFGKNLFSIVIFQLFFYLHRQILWQDNQLLNLQIILQLQTKMVNGKMSQIQELQ